ncbi:hypothetical protein OS493_035756 [Desmophyllum pertusum]|uniref:Ig-like domain-containing protein n=1 Tax=Desmophyllum pertusum TaxID=174260 RepID=A0A9X0D062_9CNID|nr:hypothetical protein OS493_035756 [Desmophyllum pertusum]
MDNSVKEPNINSKRIHYIDKLHKSSSILSVAAIMLSLALFIRIETVARDTKAIDSKFTQKIQQIQDALRETVIQQTREKEDSDIAQGNKYKRSVVRRSLPAKLNNNDQLNDTVGIKDFRDLIKRYVTSIIVGSVCLAPGKVCVAGPPGPKGVVGRPGKRGTKGIKGRKGTQGVMGPPGEPGKHGMMGDTGAPGVRGAKGNTGAPGHPGPKGEPGESISAPEFDGNPKPTVSWSKISGTGLVNKDGQDNKLQISTTGYNDSGSYVCKAANVLGQVQKVVKLFVEVPPQFTEIPDPVIKVNANTVASVVCRAFGFPPPTIDWSKPFSQLPQGRATVENGTLKISSFSLKDVGTYQCKATNKLGSVRTFTALNHVQQGKNKG